MENDDLSAARGILRAILWSLVIWALFVTGLSFYLMGKL